jgi:hypothetical protein
MDLYVPGWYAVAVVAAALGVILDAVSTGRAQHAGLRDRSWLVRQLGDLWPMVVMGAVAVLSVAGAVTGHFGVFGLLLAALAASRVWAWRQNRRRLEAHRRRP